jgi:uroporphyrinogen decarboxylase
VISDHPSADAVETAGTASGPPIGLADDPRAERFLRACRREAVDVTPVWFMRQAGRALPEYRAIRERASLADIVADADLCAEVSLQPVTRLGVDAAIVFADITTPLPGVGVPVEIVEGVGPVIADPIRSLRDVEQLRPFDPGSAVRPLLDAIGTLSRSAPVPVIGFAGAPFTLAAYLVEGRSPRGLETTKTLMRTEPATWDLLLERIVDMDLAYLAAQVAAGAKAIQLFDSWVGAVSPDDYRRSILPHVRRLFDGLRGLDVPTIHFGTGTAGLLEAMADAGGDVIGLDWRVDLGAGWARLPGKAVQGNLDPDVLLGPWDSIEVRARAILDAADSHPGHVFNLGHGVLPTTNPDVLVALVRLVHGEAP